MNDSLLRGAALAQAWAGKTTAALFCRLPTDRKQLLLGLAEAIFLEVILAFWFGQRSIEN
jgi:hypothetical protein